MKFNLKQKLKSIILPHLPAVVNPEGHMPPWLKKFVLFVLRKTYSRTFDGLSKVKIMVGPLKGKKMILNFNAGNGATDTEYLAGYRQEREEIDLLRRLVLKGQTIWDIGIYRGFYSVLFSELTGPDGKVLAFDIEEKNCRVVNEVIRLNRILNLKTYNYGLSNENTESDFISSPSSNSRLISTFRGYYTDNPVLTKGESIKKTRLTTLNSLVEKMGYPDMVKVDIDGAELFVLDEADKVFENEELVFIIESHNPQTDKKITGYFNRNSCFVYSINEKRFFDTTDLYYGTMIASKKLNKLDTLSV